MIEAGPTSQNPEGVTGRSRSSAAPIALTVGAALLLSFGDGIAKVLAQDLHPAQVVWARFLFFFIPMAVALGPRRSFRMIGQGRFVLQVLRAVLTVASAACMIVALKFIPLADATAIVFTSPALLVILSAL